MVVKSIRNSILICSLLTLLACEKTITTNSAIAAAHPLASKAGVEMYQQGGNAFDAAVAAGFALAVVEPSMSGLGGRLQAIYRKKNGKIAGVDASTEVPQQYVKSTEKIAYGYPTIGIPGVVAGLLTIHEKKGKLPLSTVLAPAINYAANGFSLLPGEAKRQQMVREKLLEFAGTKHHFLKNDSLSYQQGDQLVQKDLAHVLEAIAKKGKAGFYEGEVARRMVADFQANGGIVTLDDLKNYQARESRILTGKFHDHNVHSLYLPSFGAITIQILQILDQLEKPKDEKEWAFQQGKATALAYSFRKKQVDSIELNEILSYEKAAEWAEDIAHEKKTTALPVEQIPVSWTSVEGHTTHLTAADRWGNIVALTQTIGPNMGSKVATKGLGFLYAVTLGGYLGEYKPGDRANSHISPTLIEKEGEIVLALGAAGGSRIVPAVVQVTDRYIAQQNNLESSLALPRVYPYQDSLWLENHSGIEQKISHPFYANFPLKYIDEPARFGRVHAIAKEGESWVGAADPDWEGTTAYYPEKTED